MLDELTIKLCDMLHIFTIYTIILVAYPYSPKATMRDDANAICTNKDIF
jgi:hypothetical protein